MKIIKENKLKENSDNPILEKYFEVVTRMCKRMHVYDFSFGQMNLNAGEKNEPILLIINYLSQLVKRNRSDYDETYFWGFCDALLVYHTVKEQDFIKACNAISDNFDNNPDTFITL